MSVTILRFAAALYAAGAASYIVFFARPRHAAAARLGWALVAAGFAVHAVSIGFSCSELGGTEFFNPRGGFGLLAWLGAGGFLLLQRVYPLPAMGAFVIPLVLVAMVPGIFVLGQGSPGVLTEVLRLRVLRAHIISAAGAVALFATAFAVALMYLLQEREVKGKHFGALFSRLPSLDALDRLNQRLVRLGFVVWTVALVTGAVVAKNAWGSFWTWDPQQVAALVIWLLFGAMVHLRHRGVHGRRYAWLTLAGFALVLGSILALDAVPNVTRHGGNFQ